MNTEYEVSQQETTQKPQVFIKKIIFNDGTQLSINHNSIIVFVGANNCGKSQVLKDFEYGLNESNYIPTIVAKDFEYDYIGTILDESFLKERLYKSSDGYYRFFELDYRFEKEMFLSWWNNHTLYSGFHMLFVKRLSTEKRLLISNELIRNDFPEQHPIYKLCCHEVIAQKISDYFHQAFGTDLIVNRNEIRSIPLHIGQAPDKDKYTIKTQDYYYEQVAALPKLQEQGDGMRSFASILLDAFTTEYSIMLIDEPEAFLHPPQARILGKMLADNNSDSRQLIISTHSEDFLQGLLDANNKNVTVIRIDRKDDINLMSILENENIKILWNNPLLRYSNILSGLFHKKVVVCESDYDCLFYQAVIDAIYESQDEISPDIMFTHCGGKTRIKDVVKALKAVNIPVVAVCDFDLLNSSHIMKPIVEAFGLDWTTQLHSDMKIVYDSVNEKQGVGKNAWEELKKVGKIGFNGEAPAAYNRVEQLCKSVGLLIVPIGEIECFDKTVNKQKKDWVYYVLEHYNLATEPKLDAARKFVQDIIDYNPLD